jgi:hypothetical protein
MDHQIHMVGISTSPEREAPGRSVLRDAGLGQHALPRITLGEKPAVKVELV